MAYDMMSFRLVGATVDTSRMRTETAIRDLMEHVGGFDYDYRMHCACGAISEMTAATYAERETIDALVPCLHCGKEIHYGPYVTALRDPSDPALSNAASMAWYHTSNRADWPSSAHSDQVAEGLAKIRRSFDPQAFQRMLHRETTQALHVGTYEAAIENMLRRMRHQAGTCDVFYLHRVGLNLNSSDLNDGFRDENHEDASRLLLSDLESDGLLAVRYLNVREAAGSISMAIDAAAIDSIQTIGLPVLAVAPEPSDRLTSELNLLEAELAAAQAAMPDTSHLEQPPGLIGMRLYRRGDEELARRVSTSEERIDRAWGDVQQLLRDEYLTGMNPVVCERFAEAMSDWRRAKSSNVEEFHRYFRAHSAAFTQSQAIVNMLKAQPARSADSVDLVRARRVTRRL